MDRIGDHFLADAAFALDQHRNPGTRRLCGNRDRRGFGHIITLDVDPVRQRSGCGSTLIEALEARFVSTGCDSIRLEVAVNNRAALGFYKKHGYAVVKTLRRYYPGGLDGLLMGKRILNNDT